VDYRLDRLKSASAIGRWSFWGVRTAFRESPPAVSKESLAALDRRARYDMAASFTKRNAHSIYRLTTTRGVTAPAAVGAPAALRDWAKPRRWMPDV